jgi:hypothetical protein
LTAPVPRIVAVGGGDGVELAECVSGREGASGWRVERDGEQVVERPLETRLLRAPLPDD